ncbi:MAG TPA: TetR/AcrR family transcriptional regulator [Ktedonobacterales bacterium]
MPNDDNDDNDQRLAPRKRRAYHSPVRQRQAEETRQRMLAEARCLFQRYGYAGTTLDAIAEEAAVSAKTVVAVFGSKRGILAAALDPTTFGDQYHEMVAQLRAEPDPIRRAALLARLTRHVYQAKSVELDLLSGSRAVSPELAEIAESVEQRRWRFQERFAVFLRENGALRADLTQIEATDELWALTSFDLYRMLVIRRAWRPERYEAWLTQTLIASLIAPTAALP